MKMVRREGLDVERAPVSRCLPARWYWQYRFWLTVTGSLCNQMSTVCISSFSSWMWSREEAAEPSDRGEAKEASAVPPRPCTPL